MKRGAYDLGRKAIYMIVVVFIVAIVFLYMKSAIVQHTMRVVSEVPAVERGLVVQKIIFSGDCLAYVDGETGRVYPGIVDFKKLGGLPSGCFKYVARDVKFRLLTGKSSDLSPFAGMVVESRQVLVRDGDKIYGAVLEVGVGKA